jgi:aminopeptidase N
LPLMRTLFKTHCHFGLLFLAVVALQSCATSKGPATVKAAPTTDSSVTIQIGDINVNSRPLYQESRPVFWRLSHTWLEVRPIWAKRELEGKAVLTITPNAYPQDSLTLNARNFIIHSITEGTKPLNFSYDSSMIHIRLGHSYKPGENLKISISYTAMPYLNEGSEGYSSPISRGLYFINADGRDSIIPQELWSQGETRYNSGWFPTIDDPQQKQTQEIYITVDPQFTTLSNGELTYSSFNMDGSRTDCWQMKQPTSTYLTMIAVGNWKKVKDQWHDTVPVDYFVEPAYEPYARKIFGNTPEMLDFYSNLLGVNYPWPAFRQVVARDFVAGAMENTTAVVHFEELQQDARGLLDAHYEEYICHELFHHWFGDLVTPESWANLCLSESFATLGENLWIAHKNGSDEEELHRQEQLLDYLSDADYRNSPLVDYYYKSPEELFDHVRYEKGGLILLMLRHSLGDQIFFKGLNIYLTKNAYGNAEVGDLRQAFEEASGLDLHPFFDQWFFRAGNPNLKLSYKYDPLAKNIVLLAIQTQGRDRLFSFPLEVDIYTDATHKKRYTWNISHEKDSFIIPVDDRPLTVLFDPDKVLPSRKNIYKEPRDWYNQYYCSKGYLNKYEALEGMYKQNNLQLPDSLRLNLIQSAAHDKFWKLRQLAYTDLLTSSNAPAPNSAFVSMADSAIRYDPESRVRTAALQYMAYAEGARKLDTYISKLSDSSYEVCASALRALNLNMPEKDSARLLAVAGKFEKTDWANVAIELSLIYSRYSSYSQAAFFHRMPYYVRSVQMGKMVDAYKHWLLNLQNEDIVKEENFMENLGDKIKDVWTAASYKVLLQEAATRLEKSKEKSGEYAKTIDSLRKKASSINLKAQY